MKKKSVHGEKCNFYLVKWKSRRWSFCGIGELLKTERGWMGRSITMQIDCARWQHCSVISNKTDALCNEMQLTG